MNNLILYLRYCATLVVTLTLVHNYTYAQHYGNDDGKSLFPNISPPTIASFNKYIDHPVGLYNGNPDLSVPLYAIQDGAIQLPIALRYNNSGIKVEEEASWVGLGWNLNVGGVITQNVMGCYDQADLLYDEFKDDPLFKTPSTVGGFANLYLNSELEYRLKDLIAGNRYGLHAYRPQITGKLKPDVFYFSYPGNSGKFMIDPQTNVPYILVREQAIDVKVNYGELDLSGLPHGKGQQAISSFTITTTEGVEYIFKNACFTYGRTNNLEDILSASYMLSETVYPNGQKIIYTYGPKKKSSKWTCSELIEKRERMSGTHSGLNVPYIEKAYRVGKHFNADTRETEDRATHNVAEEYCLKSIRTTNYHVLFVTSEREDYEDSEKLDEIIIGHSKDDGMIFKFDYSYFESQFYLGKNWNIGRWNINSPEKERKHASHRLKLNSVKSPLGGEHNFFYNEKVQLPRKDSYAVDYWGYYNGQEKNETFLPDMDLLLFGSYNEYDRRIKIETERLPKAKRYHDLYYIKAGMLTGIEYPTGGYMEYTYDSNIFHEIGIDQWPNILRRTVAFTPSAASIHPYPYPSLESVPSFIPSSSDIDRAKGKMSEKITSIGGWSVDTTSFISTMDCEGILKISLNAGSVYNFWDKIQEIPVQYSVVEVDRNGIDYHMFSYHRDDNIFSNSTEMQEREFIKSISLKQGKRYKLFVKYPDTGEYPQYGSGSASMQVNYDKKPMIQSTVSSGCGVKVSYINHYESKNKAKLLQSKHYDYGKGMLHSPVNFAHIKDNLVMTSTNISNEGVPGSKVDRFYMNMIYIYGNNSISNPYGFSSGVGYSTVREYDIVYNDTEDMKTKTIYEFHNHKSGYKPGFFKIENNDIGLSDSSQDAKPNAILNGKIKSKTTIKDYEVVDSKEEYTYAMKKTHKFWGFNVDHNLNVGVSEIAKENTISMGWVVEITTSTECSSDYYCSPRSKTTQSLCIDCGDIKDWLDASVYELFSYDVTLTKKESILDGVKVTETYSYNPSTLLLRERTITGSDGLYQYRYSYPSDYSCGIYSTMSAKNILTPIIEERLYKNNFLIGGKLTEYDWSNNNSNNIIKPSKIYYAEIKDKYLLDKEFKCPVRKAEVFPNERITYKKFDRYGNVTHIEQDGIASFYLWSYGGQYPIAEIVNATYDQVEAAVKQSFSISNIDALSEMSNPPVEKIESLRDNSNLKNAHVSTYSYRPLLGMVKSTNPSGLTTSYSYYTDDYYGKLKGIYFIDNGVPKVIQIYNYNHRNK